MADGENVERLWSSLGLLAYITREMSATTRQDLLVDSLLHISRKCIAQAPATMGKRLSAAMQQAESSRLEIARMCRTEIGKFDLPPSE